MPRAATMPCAGLPHLVVDGEHPVVAVGRQLPPRVAAEHCRRAVLGGGRSKRDVDDVAVGDGEVGGVLQVGVGDSDLDVRLVGKPLSPQGDPRRQRPARCPGSCPRRTPASWCRSAAPPTPGSGWRRCRRRSCRRPARNRRSARWRRRAVPVAAPTVRRLSSHSAPGGPVNTVGAIADSSREGLRRQRLRAQDQVGVGGLDGLPGRARCGYPRPARRARRCRDTTAGWPSRRAARRRRCGTADPARTARRAGRRRAPRCVAGRRAPGAGARRMADLTIRRAGSSARRLGCARFVGPALVAEHAGTGDLGGAGDDRLLTARVDGGLPPSDPQPLTTVIARPRRGWRSPRPAGPRAVR